MKEIAKVIGENYVNEFSDYAKKRFREDINPICHLVFIDKDDELVVKEMPIDIMIKGKDLYKQDMLENGGRFLFISIIGVGEKVSIKGNHTYSKEYLSSLPISEIKELIPNLMKDGCVEKNNILFILTDGHFKSFKLFNVIKSMSVDQSGQILTFNECDEAETASNPQTMGGVLDDIVNYFMNEED